MMNCYRKPMIISFALMVLALCMMVAYSNGYGHGAAMKQSSTYAMAGYVVEVDESLDQIAIENTAGEIYIWGSAKWWQVNDIVAITMDSMGTSDITDDQILDISLVCAAE